jgi:hypothetical protein
LRYQRIYLDDGNNKPGFGNRHKKDKYEKFLEEIEQEKDLDIKQELRKGNKVTIIE